MITKQVENKGDDFVVNCVNTTVQDSPYRVEGDDEAVKAVGKHNPLPPAGIDPSIDKWFYFSGNL